VLNTGSTQIRDSNYPEPRWRNSADVSERQSHTANDGRSSHGNRRFGRRTRRRRRSGMPPGSGSTGPPAATPAAPAAAPAPLSTFVLTGPLQWLPPATFDAGPLGKLSVNGIVTGFSQFQNNSVPGDDNAQATLSNGQIFIQKADGSSVLRPGGRLHHADAQRAVC
jgi:hypothetical protein